MNYPPGDDSVARAEEARARRILPEASTTMGVCSGPACSAFIVHEQKLFLVVSCKLIGGQGSIITIEPEASARRSSPMTPSRFVSWNSLKWFLAVGQGKGA